MPLDGPYNSAFSTLCTTIPAHISRSKKTKIQSHNLAAAILEGLMPITTEDEPEDVDDDAACRVRIDSCDPGKH